MRSRFSYIGFDEIDKFEAAIDKEVKKRKSESIQKVHSNDGITYTGINSTIDDISSSFSSLEKRVEKLERESVKQPKRGHKKLRISISA